jgi:hypothetical protein
MEGVAVVHGPVAAQKKSMTVSLIWPMVRCTNGGRQLAIMSPTFELRYGQGPTARRSCQPAQVVEVARQIFQSEDVSIVEAWLFGRHMYSIDRKMIEPGMNRGLTGSWPPVQGGSAIVAQQR